MKNNIKHIKKILVLGCILKVSTLYAAPCDESLKVTGFAQVKDKKSYFYSDAHEKTKKKSYLVTDDFIQILGVPDRGFVCAKFRNYKGYGGRKTIGWMFAKSLTTIKIKLDRSDLLGTWYKSPCADESCAVEIAEESKKLSVSLHSYLHDRPSESYTAESVEEKESRLILTRLKGTVDGPERVEIEYGMVSEPGTIEISGPEGWTGSYHR